MTTGAAAGESAGPWTAVEATVEPELAERAADALWQAGAAGIEERDSPAGPVLVAGCPDPTTARRAADAVTPLARSVRLVEIVDDGLDAWRDSASTVEAGPFLVHPAWLPDPEPAPGQVLLRIEPGRTFGSGSHVTSRLVLAEAARLTAPGIRVLDVGCGSGILAVGAALAGAASVIAVDVDPDAPPVTAANAAVNGVADRVRASSDTLADVLAEQEPFDLMLANLLAPTIRDLATELVAATADRGRLVVSGLLADRWTEATAHLAPLEVETVREAEGWVAVTLAPPATRSP